MTLKQLKQELITKPSYFKESAQTISKRFKCDIRLVYQALGELRDERKAYNKKKLSIKTGKRNPQIPVNIIKEAVEQVYKKNKVTSNISCGFTVSRKQLPRPFLTGDPKNVLIIGDTHLPFEKEGYLEFCREQQEKFNCGTVVHIGDLVDNHAISYHEHDSEGRSAGDEYRDALARCHDWYKVFPNVKICIGNHDALPFRKAFTAGLPSAWLKSYQEILESPKTWEWDFTHVINDVVYQHGTGLSGEMAAVNAARENRQSTVIGHLHTVCNTRFLASFKDLIFGMTVGCGIDHEAYAFAYGRQQTRKPVISCGVVLNGQLPITIPMTF